MRAWMLALLLGGLLLARPGLADVFTYIDAEGNRVFTDQPRVKGAQRVMVTPPNSATLPKPAAPKRVEEEEVPPPLPSYQMLRIAIPEPDATIQSNSGGLVVALESDPVLMAGHAYRLELDGKTYGTPSRSPVFTLDNIERGTHQLAGEIVDADGHVLERTPTQPFHLRQVSVIQRQKVNPCTEENSRLRIECQHPKDKS